MSRFAAIHLMPSVALLALLLSFEGTSYARTTAQPLLVAHEAPAAQGTKSSGELPDASVAIRPIETEIARIRICHISRHPRDGMPAAEHACPLVVADAAEVLAPAAVAAPN